MYLAAASHSMWLLKKLGRTLLHFFFSKGLAMPRPHNVLIPSIMNLAYLGYKELYIVGADHSWLSEITVNENNEALHQLCVEMTEKVSSSGGGTGNAIISIRYVHWNTLKVIWIVVIARKRRGNSRKKTT